MMQEYCILEKQRQIEEIQDNYNYRGRAQKYEAA